MEAWEAAIAAEASNSMSDDVAMTRIPDWEMKLSNFMTANQHRPFEWGAWDCILFATAAAAEITGVDRGANYRGRYSNREGAAIALREIGQGTLLRTVDAQFKRKAVSKAQRGDLVWCQGCVGVCLGQTAAFISEREFLDIAAVPRLGSFVLLPRRFWRKAWGV